ncbi:Transcription factor [Arthroderma uncinatum]|uniref:Transcription factor n=1 Tax=Arthroderma uncinatum TaxID=74035 RepID=UPI00144A71B0|nr:Transcription factor [Arthroderma uncinatum]KAF3483935.1 Transcription factor [Arthroderma uncinatum]
MLSPKQTATARTRRPLACVLCQQRKIKSNRQQRRRFPERELLARLRHYEGLLRQHNVKFDPLHTRDGREKPPDGVQSEGIIPEADTTEKNAGVGSRSVDIWRAMGQKGDPKDGDDGNDGEDDENDSGFLHANDDI